MAKTAGTLRKSSIGNLSKEESRFAKEVREVVDRKRADFIKSEGESIPDKIKEMSTRNLRSWVDSYKKKPNPIGEFIDEYVRKERTGDYIRGSMISVNGPFTNTLLQSVAVRSVIYKYIPLMKSELKRREKNG
ncbi:MAG TPA: hypothetical protein DDW85_02330 [Porphyromonadaceae bacterium]|nr:hypothetical protein [Porphyromonadaceae bacterium]